MALDPATATIPWWGPPAATAAGGLLEAGISSAFNAFQASKNRDFQERMSSTAHQREVADLRKAGLNPILSARHGGASSPPGAQASATPSSATANAMQAMQMRGQLELLKAQVADTNSAAALKQAQAADLLKTQPQRIGQMIAQAYQALQSGNLSGEERTTVISRIRHLEAQAAQARSQAAHGQETLHRERVKSKPWEYGGKAIDWLEKAAPKVESSAKGFYEFIKKDPLKEWLKRKVRR